MRKDDENADPGLNPDEEEVADSPALAVKAAEAAWEEANDAVEYAKEQRDEAWSRLHEARARLGPDPETACEAPGPAPEAGKEEGTAIDSDGDGMTAGSAPWRALELAALEAARAWGEARDATARAKETEDALWDVAVRAATAADQAMEAYRAAGPRGDEVWGAFVARCLASPGAKVLGLNPDPAEEDIEVLVSFFSCVAAAAVPKGVLEGVFGDELERADVAWASVLRCIRRCQGKTPPEDEREAARRRRLGMKAK